MIRLKGLSITPHRDRKTRQPLVRIGHIHLQEPLALTLTQVRQIRAAMDKALAGSTDMRRGK